MFDFRILHSLVLGFFGTDPNCRPTCTGSKVKKSPFTNNNVSLLQFVNNIKFKSQNQTLTLCKLHLN